MSSSFSPLPSNQQNAPAQLKAFAAAVGAAEGFHGDNPAAGNALFALGAFETAEIINQANGISQKRSGEKKAIARAILEPKKKIAQQDDRHSGRQLISQPDHEFGQLPEGKIHGKSPPSPVQMIAYPAGSYKKGEEFGKYI